MSDSKAQPAEHAEKPASSAPDIPYEQARDELIEVVRKLEAGGTTLDESLALWERGEHLAGACQQWLDGARARLQHATQATPGAEEPGTG